MFKKRYYTITTSITPADGSQGFMEPAGIPATPVIVGHSDDITFNMFLPPGGWEVEDVTVDGISQGIIPSGQPSRKRLRR